ncbi:uncharacterized protein [Palaemon carinicauda]|uniref:uncharacterized protein n=1 Tax=Palaemon carinicauda TaxID=392227 RepID=UPI0035B6A066
MAATTANMNNESDFVKQLSGDDKRFYKQKLDLIDGLDPYHMQNSFSQNIEDFPSISYIDMVNYLTPNPLLSSSLTIKKRKKDNHYSVKIEVIQQLLLGTRKYIFAISLSLKRKAFNRMVLLVLTYASETFNLTKALEHKLVIQLRAMEIIMMIITLRDRKSATWIREETKVDEKEMDMDRAFMRLTDNKWTLRITEYGTLDIAIEAGERTEDDGLTS